MLCLIFQDKNDSTGKEIRSVSPDQIFVQEVDAHHGLHVIDNSIYHMTVSCTFLK